MSTNMRSRVPSAARRLSVNSTSTSNRQVLSKTVEKSANNENRIEHIEEVISDESDKDVLISLQYNITFEASSEEITPSTIGKFLKNYTANGNIISGAIFIFSVNENTTTNMYTLMCLISNNINIENLKSKIITNLAKPNSVNFELVNTFKATDPYNVWVYTNSTTGILTYYNVPNLEYANLIMKYDPFVYKGNDTFIVSPLTEERKSELTYIQNDPFFVLSRNYYDIKEQVVAISSKN